MSRPRVPRVIVIPDPRSAIGTDPFPAGGGFAPIIERLAAAALAGGADAIQLRAKELRGPRLVALGRRLAARCREAGALFFVNDSPSVALDCGADGVHVGPDDCPPEQARRLLGSGGIIGVSCYGDADLARAEAGRADYVAIGAVWPTATKAIAVVGLEGVRRLRAATALPIIAIGGVDARTAAEAIAAGADGVAVISAVCGAPDPAAATREICAAVDEALSKRGQIYLPPADLPMA